MKQEFLDKLKKAQKVLGTLREIAEELDTDVTLSKDIEKLQGVNQSMADLYDQLEGASVSILDLENIVSESKGDKHMNEVQKAEIQIVIDRLTDIENGTCVRTETEFVEMIDKLEAVLKENDK